MMKLLVVQKKSARSAEAPRWNAQPAWVRTDQLRRKQALETHNKTLEQVQQVLKSVGIAYEMAYRSSCLDHTPFDGVISVGGDGTFLEAARGVRSHQWILGVNSDPKRSVGSFCAATRTTFEEILKQFFDGEGRVIKLERLLLEMNGAPLEVQVLNDVLITHRTPAAMSRYRLEVGRVKEEQRSSGLWIATAAGSTGAIRSAGGQALPRESPLVQYRPRELCRGDRFQYKLTGGSVALKEQPIRIGCLMREGLVCADGEHTVFPFGYGNLLSVKRSPYPLQVVIK